MNVLLTSAGRRRYLVDYFRDALAGTGKVYAADSAGEAAAMQYADGNFLVPRVADVKYIDTLLQICEQANIGVVVSLNDLELPVLAANRDRFQQANVISVVSSPGVIDICFDKWKTYQFLSQCGIGCAVTFISIREVNAALGEGRLSFPLVVKPRWGSASVGVEFVEDWEELRFVHTLAVKRMGKSNWRDSGIKGPEEGIIIQEFLCGQEYGVDVVNDLEGRHIAVFAREKLIMRAGETDRAKVVLDGDLQDTGRRIGNHLQHVANLDCDVFKNGGHTYVLEMNPRFGGGYPFSHESGADVPSAILAWARGEKADSRWFSVRPGDVVSKYDLLVACKRAA